MRAVAELLLLLVSQDSGSSHPTPWPILAAPLRGSHMLLLEMPLPQAAHDSRHLLPPACAQACVPVRVRSPLRSSLRLIAVNKWKK